MFDLVHAMEIARLGAQGLEVGRLTMMSTWMLKQRGGVRTSTLATRTTQGSTSTESPQRQIEGAVGAVMLCS